MRWRGLGAPMPTYWARRARCHLPSAFPLPHISSQTLARGGTSTEMSTSCTHCSNGPACHHIDLLVLLMMAALGAVGERSARAEASGSRSASPPAERPQMTGARVLEQTAWVEPVAVAAAAVGSVRLWPRSKKGK